MPIYEYKAKDENNSCKLCKNIFEITQKITDNTLGKCPNCGADIIKIVSKISGFIIGGKEMNQYNDVKKAKYWRDSNGVRHRVTSADGDSKSPTISNRRTASSNDIAKQKSIDSAKDSRKRRRQSYKRSKNAIRSK